MTTETVAARLDALRVERRYDEADALWSAHADVADGDGALLVARARLCVARLDPAAALPVLARAKAEEPSYEEVLAWRIAALCRLSRFP